jgi:hypothetical protein
MQDVEEGDLQLQVPVGGLQDPVGANGSPRAAMRRRRLSALHPDLGELDASGRDLLGILTRKAIRRGTFASVAHLVQAIRIFIDAWNERCQPFQWTKAPEQIPAKAMR